MASINCEYCNGSGRGNFLRTCFNCDGSGTIELCRFCENPLPTGIFSLEHGCEGAELWHEQQFIAARAGLLDVRPVARSPLEIYEQKTWSYYPWPYGQGRDELSSHYVEKGVALKLSELIEECVAESVKR